MSHIRPRKVESLIQEEIGNLFLNGGLHDPRLHGRLTVTAVEVSSDLRYAKVFVSHLGKAEEDAGVFEALAGAAGYVQSVIAKSIRLRFVPKVSFVPDHSIERGVDLVHKIDNLFKPQ